MRRPFLWVRAALDCDRFSEQSTGCLRSQLFPWLDTRVRVVSFHCSILGFVEESTLFAWALAYSQESEASDLAQADRVTAKSRRVGWTSFQKQFKGEAESHRG